MYTICPISIGETDVIFPNFISLINNALDEKNIWFEKNQTNQNPQTIQLKIVYKNQKNENEDILLHRSVCGANGKVFFFKHDVFLSKFKCKRIAVKLFFQNNEYLKERERIINLNKCKNMLVPAVFNDDCEVIIMPKLDHLEDLQCIQDTKLSHPNFSLSHCVENVFRALIQITVCSWSKGYECNDLSRDNIMFYEKDNKIYIFGIDYGMFNPITIIEYHYYRCTNSKQINTKNFNNLNKFYELNKKYFTKNITDKDKFGINALIVSCLINSLLIIFNAKEQNFKNFEIDLFARLCDGSTLGSLKILHLENFVLNEETKGIISNKFISFFKTIENANNVQEVEPLRLHEKNALALGFTAEYDAMYIRDFFQNINIFRGETLKWLGKMAKIPIDFCIQMQKIFDEDENTMAELRNTYLQTRMIEILAINKRQQMKIRQLIRESDQLKEESKQLRKKNEEMNEANGVLAYRTGNYENFENQIKNLLFIE